MAKRFITLVLAVALVTVFTGCTFLILPKPKQGRGEDIVYFHLHQDSVAKVVSTEKTVSSQTPAVANVITTGGPNDLKCHNLIPPSFGNLPALTVLTNDQRKDVELVENTMVDYALALRTYISNMHESSTQFFNAYNQACKSVSPPMIQ
ncbi:MAG TPA: hypothetical protein VN081_02505 [Dongiaceae bacterium]|nr:hypothetical protein [Dongiaceae bacterium]